MNQNQKISFLDKIIVFFKKLFIKTIKYHFRVLIIIFVFFLLHRIWGFEASFFLSLFLLFLFLHIDSRIFIFFGLLFLLTCPFWLLFKKPYIAEEMAIYAYYFLFLGVILQLIESYREDIPKKNSLLYKIRLWLGKK